MWNCAVFEKTLFDTRLRNSFAFSNAKVAFRNLESKITIFFQLAIDQMITFNTSLDSEKKPIRLTLKNYMCLLKKKLTIVSY
jgi:hypothetical protein